jgi:hypothetical protein
MLNCRLFGRSSSVHCMGRFGVIFGHLDKRDLGDDNNWLASQAAALRVGKTLGAKHNLTGFALEPIAGKLLFALCAIQATSTYFVAVRSQCLVALASKIELAKETQPLRGPAWVRKPSSPLDGVEPPVILLNASPQRPSRMPNQRKSSYDVAIIHQQNTQ